MQGPDRPHERRRLRNDDLDERTGLALRQWQVVDARQVSDHADIDERRGEQIGDRDRIQGNRDTLTDAISLNEAITEFAARRQDTAANRVAEIGSEQARVQCGQCFPLALENLPEFQPQRLDVGIAGPLCRRFPARCVNLDHGLGPRLGRNEKYVPGRDQSCRPCADRFQQRFLFFAGKEICFVDRDEHRTAATDNRAQ